MEKDNKLQIFRPSPIYNELQILTLISNHDDLTQRDIAKHLGVSSSIVNEYLTTFFDNGLIIKDYKSKKVVLYKITKKGIERRKQLNMEYLKASLSVYTIAKEECASFLNALYNDEYKNLLFYGAGEVCELFLFVINDTLDLNINVHAVIDDDESKIGKKIVNKDIIGIKDINKYNYDGIFISSHTNAEINKNKLLNVVEKKKIVEYFDW